MNHYIFFKLHSLAHQSELFDSIILFLSEYFIMALVVLVGGYFFFNGLYKNENKLNKLKDNFKKIIFIISPAAISWAFADVIKNFFSSPRPFLLFEEQVKPIFIHGGMDSFPSGHSTFMSAFALSVYFFNKKLGILIFISAIIIGVSRVIAGIHFPVDIIGGYILGLIFTFIFEQAFKKRKNF